MKTNSRNFGPILLNSIIYLILSPRFYDPPEFISTQATQIHTHITHMPHHYFIRDTSHKAYDHADKLLILALLPLRKKRYIHICILIAHHETRAKRAEHTFTKSFLHTYYLTFIIPRRSCSCSLLSRVTYEHEILSDTYKVKTVCLSTLHFSLKEEEQVQIFTI